MLVCVNSQVRTLPEPDRSLAFFKGAVNSSAVWCPEHTNHSLWITNLVCSLIDSGAIYDELLRLVTQISKVKVCIHRCLQLDLVNPNTLGPKKYVKVLGYKDNPLRGIHTYSTGAVNAF